MKQKKFVFYFMLLVVAATIQCRPDKEAMNQRQQNMEAALRLYSEVLNKGNLDLLNDLLAEDFIDHNASDGPAQGIEPFKDFLRMVTTGFPDLQLKVEDILADGNKVVVRLTITGTQTGVLMDVPPSGKKATWTGIDILEIQDGKITGRWSERNLLGMMMQIGAFPGD